MSTTPPVPEALRSQSPDLSDTNPEVASLKAETTHAQCPCISSPSSDHSTENKKPWDTVLDCAKKHVNEEIIGWKGEVDTLLIFATVFAGVAGAFAIESYHNVKQDPAETTVLLLRSLLILQLNATNPQPNLPIELDPHAPVTATAKRINIYNFLSLILSLSVVMTGILCVQWFREYAQVPSGIPGPRHEHLGIHYMRREGMQKWGVFIVLKTLPTVLILSLLLFFAGIIELLSEVDESATIATSVMIGIMVSFILFTTMLPTFYSFWMYFFPRFRIPECPYKSPQAWFFYRAFTIPVRFFARLFAWAISRCCGRIFWGDPRYMDLFNLQTWSGFDWLIYSTHTHLPQAMANVGLGIHWLAETYLQEKHFAEAVYQCIQDSSMLDSLRSILAIRDARRAVSVDEASIWFPQDVPEDKSYAKTQAHLSNVIIFQTLAHLAEKIERGHPPTILLKERLDLYHEINKTRLDVDVDCPPINDMAQKEVIPHGVRKTLVSYITGLIQHCKDINGSHLSALEHIVELEFDMDDPDDQLLRDVLLAVQSWIEYQGWDVEVDPGQQSHSSKTKLQIRALKLENVISVFRRTH